MIYEEKTNWNLWIAAFVLIGIIAAFVPWIPDTADLSSEEGYYLAMANGIQGVPPILTIHGELHSGSFPLFPLLVRAIGLTGADPVFSLRLLPLICAVILAGIIFLTAWRALGSQAATVGTMMLFTTVIAADQLTNGNPIMLTSLAAFSAWMIWFDLGPWRNDWNTAWCLAFILLGLCFYNAGWLGASIVVLPMVFQRRPLMLWTKPRNAGYYAGIAAFVICVLLWAMPRWYSNDDYFFRAIGLSWLSTEKYLLHLLLFPWQVALRFMPWTLFIWAPFCPAIMPLDKNPLLSKYLRTLVLALFFMLWITPLYHTSDLLLLAPPLSLLTALHYWIVVRRYGLRILNLSKIASLAALVFSMLMFLGLLFPAQFSHLLRKEEISYQLWSTTFYPGMVYTIGGILCAVLAFILAASKARIWLVLTLVFAAFFLPYRGVFSLFNESHRHFKLGQIFAESLHETEAGTQSGTLYKMRNIPAFFPEMYYTGADVRIIGSADELPEDEKTVFVLASGVPTAPERVWKLIHAEQYRKTNLELWRGDFRMDDEDE